ncbi:uncharacterized protein GLRG_11450 [Colletotrichum graminicola M1.001]|uniref:Uncharacterized protein n=1 Tax=Colletotrichum graminicola (strain M1.001 / M2 / FGSC 10212) TaxID=645133 RepID=E3QZL7_COLGM|nr:uncharacterized protein GLRG_11450 [Colletotrichum graminicola M1.001]EFQ36305.1 hypothetical protein GLRG_11450 [Colletotrichum graminicola M1.001]
MSDSSDFDDDSCTSTLGCDRAGCHDEGGSEEGGNVLFSNPSFTGQNRASLVVHKQKKHAVEERRARHAQSSPAGSSAAYPLDLYLVDTEGATRGYRLVAAGVEASGSFTLPREEHDESDEVAPIWAIFIFICIFIAFGGIILRSEWHHTNPVDDGS